MPRELPLDDGADHEPFLLDKPAPDPRWRCETCDRVEGECPGHDDPADLVEYTALLVRAIDAMRGRFPLPPEVVRLANRCEDVIRLRYPEVM